MSDFKLTTPVAFIIFNRPDTTERVFAEIAKAKPTKLLVVADGPRQHKEGEAEKVKATRAIIDRVDWPCEVLTNYSEDNLGCKVRVSSGIDWVFEQVEEAIILEDDCLPDPTFFRFCQEMLERYRNDQRIGMISGDNFQFGKKRNNDSYYFSKYVHIWGWATWRDRWQGSYDVELKKWPIVKDEKWLKDMLRSKNESTRWLEIFENLYKGKIDTWDYQWMFCLWLSGRINVMPNVNLISNIGFGDNATHTTNDSEIANLEIQKLLFPLTHPIGIFANIDADIYTFNQLLDINLLKKSCFQLAKFRKILVLNFNKFNS
jgi:hypothetical protein